MKKKGVFKILSLFLVLCFALFSFAGCGGAAGDGTGEGTDDQNTILLDGAKVLTRPENYDFSEAVGDYSENYFNIYAANILTELYNTYALTLVKDNNEELPEYLTGTEYADLFDDSEEDKVKKLFLYDSMRYTITSVAVTKDSGTQEVISQTITLDTNYSWDWSINALATGLEPYFYKDDEFAGGEYLKATYNSSTKTIVVEFLEMNDENAPYTTWTEISPKLSNYSDTYYGKQVMKTSEVVNFFTSPSYGNDNDTTVKLNNYFQDALEYAVYMISLGYTVDADSNYFDFEISYNNSTKLVSNIKVGGWETNKISISSALENAKEKYEKQTNIVGLTEANLEEVSKFILQKVIGTKALEKDRFSADGKTFNRDYEKIVSNIVTYACVEAPIGFVDGSKVTLSDVFLTSKITDFQGDYFGIDIMGDSSSDSDDKYSDKNLFKNIDAAEYQSVVLFPRAEHVGLRLTDIWVGFEYYELPENSTKVMDTENGITINVGIRYFNMETGQVTEIAKKQIVVMYAKNGEIDDKPVTMICFGEDDIGVDAQFSTSPVINTVFDNDVDGGIINALENGTADPTLGDNKKSLQITGIDSRKDYYTTLPSSSYGSYGVLNSDKFVGVCDYIEIYFDIVKDKASAANKSYAFKVGTTLFTEDANLK